MTMNEVLKVSGKILSTALFALSCSVLLTGCEQLGLDTVATREAEGRAIGSACHHSGRALEDCYAMNKKASKSAIFNGWRDMDAYMRENSIEIIPALGVPKTPKKAAPADEAGGHNAESPPEPAADGAPPPDGKAAPVGGRLDRLPSAPGKMV